MVFLTLVAIIILAMLVLAGFRMSAWWRETAAAEALAPVNGQFVETGLGTIHVSVWGNDNPKTVVMTHGMAAWGGLWQETAEVLQSAGYRVIAVDMPPFGFSNRDDTDFSRSRQAQRLKALETALDLKDYFLVGHSYGGGIALEMALLHPENVRALVLVAPVIGLEPEDMSDVVPAEPGMAQNLLGNDMIAEALVSLSITNPLATSFLTKQFMHRKVALTQRHIDILQQPMRLKGNTPHMVGWLRQFLSGDPDAVSPKRSRVANARLPISLIWGEEDVVTPIVQGDELSRVRQPVRFTRLADVGHMPQLEAPNVFAKVLVETLVDFNVAAELELRGAMQETEPDTTAVSGN
ncbi:putative hydrolase or acyltransferase of alpha/beta superfamily [Hoeflea sp. IMCC20628]|uniref:alpha/beta fold hydrolase n=1 Tax=Hoeflea sp. IMCC20628 TaxID=1620421 RepID=UPI00063BD36C|nr:alpha/beta hydrolase [Hoeflea sp. IMCC20628]AKH99991.1 putative hydrolase or acyltransferase of alpha/beta superfamily [Hoeflea sp. IMCC20628]